MSPVPSRPGAAPLCSRAGRTLSSLSKRLNLPKVAREDRQNLRKANLGKQRSPRRRCDAATTLRCALLRSSRNSASAGQRRAARGSAGEAALGSAPGLDQLLHLPPAARAPRPAPPPRRARRAPWPAPVAPLPSAVDRCSPSTPAANAQQRARKAALVEGFWAFAAFSALFGPGPVSFLRWMVMAGLQVFKFEPGKHRCQLSGCSLSSVSLYLLRSAFAGSFLQSCCWASQDHRRVCYCSRIPALGLFH